MSLDSSGNLAVDFVWGNLPIQPNTERSTKLGVGDSHKLANTSWNAFPDNIPGTGPAEGVFIMPNLWPCTGGNFAKLDDVIAELVSYGVPAAYFKDFTFHGGANEWDANGTANWDGCILYSYIPANVVVTVDAQGVPVYGSDMAGRVFGSEQNAGNEVSTNTGNPEDYMLYVFSNDPRKNNVGWWW